MTRLTDLKDVLFPVELRPVLASIPDPDGEHLERVGNKKAIVNLTKGQVLGIVSSGYRLVTNREALEMAFQCCRAVFPETAAIEWQVTAADAPATAGHCFIDLRHNSTALDFNSVPASERPDVFGPFIRVTNSYNGLRALTFDIGFYRKVCSNGWILPRGIIQFRFNHARRDIPDRIEFAVARGRLDDLKASLGDILGALRKCVVPRTDFEPIIHKSLNLHEPQSKNAPPHHVEDWPDLVAHLSKLSDKYAETLGETAYAVFNVITEFASHPPSNHCIHRDRNGLQQLAGTWLNSFSQDYRKPGFSLSDYTTNLTSAAAA